MKIPQVQTEFSGDKQLHPRTASKPEATTIVWINTEWKPGSLISQVSSIIASSPFRNQQQMVRSALHVHYARGGFCCFAFEELG